MIIPFHDDNPLSLIPFQLSTFLIIGLCSLVFLVEIFLVDGVGFVAAQMGVVPAEIMSGESCWPDTCRLPQVFTLLTNIFVHAGWLHFLGNMLFLWVFGDNVEDSMGHIRFLVFFLICGFFASLTHVLFNMDSTNSMIGASGAIAGVMGAYLILHPKVKVWVLVLLRIPIRLPARIVLLAWVAFQFLAVANNSSGNVAVWAHIGGFAAGVVLIPFFKYREIPLFDRGTSH